VGEGRHFIHRFQRVLIHRKAVILIELHQIANAGRMGESAIPESGFVHGAKRIRQTISENAEYHEIDP
jgi:hypothetical protein